MSTNPGGTLNATTWPPTDSTSKTWPADLSTTNPTQWNSTVVPPASRKLGDPNYRWYNCNLQAPRIKCDQVDATTANFTTFGPNGIRMYSGIKSSSTTHTFTSADIPELANTTMTGELTLYLTNKEANVSNVTMTAITKANSTFPTGGTVLYQRVGNFTSVEFTTSDANKSITFTISPAAACTWIFRGV